jgi:sulfite exporter TauE/SafE/copper chaperone CopZ
MAKRNKWQLKIENMTCAHCEIKVEQTIKSIDPTLEIKASYSRSEAVVKSDKEKVDFKQIKSALESEGYAVVDVKKESAQTVSQPTKEADKLSPLHLVGIGIAVLGIYLLINNTIGFNFIPEIKPGMGYGVLFVIGLLTSLHCISMCGGINLSQCLVTDIQTLESNKTKRWMQKIKPSFLYNGGRVISYTIIGGLVGALGSVVTFSGMAKGMITIVTGIFMIIMGLNMLSLFPWLRKLNPKMPKIFANMQLDPKNSKRPFYVGLLNGLMPCGPLQAMQLYALGTGSAITGALSMLAFSLGTMPLMFGFGAISSLLSRKFTKSMLKVSAALVILLGFVMMSRGFALNGTGISYGQVDGWSVAKLDGDVQNIVTPLEGRDYPAIVVQKGVPVRWVIDAEATSLNGCNNRINLNKFGQPEIPLYTGENVIEFTPTESGSFFYSCWMGMISGQIKVVDDINALDTSFAENEKTIQIPGASSTGGCCAP